ncbi:hypothetical protein G4V62_03095 [Bacillaceae bacterium SIJ1]|uniref:hypothetical protein n=1 Tax=Litoribacterium kuwaitense TaxID=1398745 RepID=UPI0013EB2481|nr:hypothetical protein [Litoribacterium kuwaitense]NGP43985.1 hypothetical protein [Litoribacterium kuwaitense]
MVYEQFIFEISKDFNSLFVDFEEALLLQERIDTFDEYFHEITQDDDLMNEIIVEAERFGRPKDLFLDDLYQYVKNFNGAIEKHITLIEHKIDAGEMQKEEQLKARFNKTRLERALA